MLSSQTKDEVTDAAVNKLRQAVGGTLSLEAVLAADESTISEAINKVGFWRRKTQFSALLSSLFLPHVSIRSPFPSTSRRFVYACRHSELFIMPYSSTHTLFAV